MAAQIARIYNPDIGELLVVPGTDPEQILKDAAGEIEDGEKVFTSFDEVKVRWWRVSPCHPNSCGEGGGHQAHYEDHHGRTRGSFQAAGIVIGSSDDWDGA
jgi:hypothetical protein